MSWIVKDGRFSKMAGRCKDIDQLRSCSNVLDCSGWKVGWENNAKMAGRCKDVDQLRSCSNVLDP